MASKRSKTSNTVFYALLGLLVVGLGGFGAQNFSGSIKSIGTVGDRQISVTTYANALRQQMNQLTQQFGSQLTFQQAQAIGIDRAVRTQVVTTAALDNETDRIGLSVGDDRVRAALLAIPSFRGLAGTFDRAAYTFTLQQNGLTEREFEAQVRDEAARGLLQGAVVGGIKAPDNYTGIIFAHVAEQRSFRVIRLDEAALPAPVPEPDEAAIKAYYDANPAPFTRPEAKAITYAKLLPDMLTAQITPDEQALKDLYQSRLPEFVQPERRLIERLVFGTDAEAAAAKARIDAGEITFEQAVTERGLTLADIDLGDLGKADLGAAADAVFALTEPGVAGPFASPLGPALFRMNGILAAQETTFEQARPALATDLALEQTRKLILTQISDIDDRLAGGATLEQLADETDMALGTLDYFPGASDPMLDYAGFRAAADALTADDFPAIIELDDGGIAAMRLDSIKPPALKPLETVRAEVITAWKAAETQSRLKALATELKSKLENATPETLGLAAENIGPLKRTAASDTVPAALLDQAFQMAEAETRLIEEPGQITILTVTRIRPAETGTPAEGSEDAGLRTRIAASVSQSLAADLFELYSGALEAQAGIRLDEAAINAVHAQIQ